jgi:hypothetical protein
MQNLTVRNPQQSLSADLIRFRPDEKKFNQFKEALCKLLGNIDKADREKNYENHIWDFLLDAFYKDVNAINGKGDINLVVHEGKTEREKVDVIIETKRPSSTEMLSVANPNNKALRQAILYFMNERVDEKNDDLKHVVITNFKEWFIFKAADFNNFFTKIQRFLKNMKSGAAVKKLPTRPSIFITKSLWRRNM